MYSFRFLFSHLCQLQEVIFQYLRSSLVFLALYLLFFLPSQHLEITKSHTLFILQFIGLLTVFIQASSLFKADFEDGTLEKWIANQGGAISYLVVRYITIILKVIFPVMFLFSIFLYSLGLGPNQLFFFLGAFIVNMMISIFWCGNISLLLVARQDGGALVIGMLLVGLFLIPQLLIGQELSTEIFSNSTMPSHTALFCGISLVNTALSLGFGPFIVRFSVNN